MSEINLQDGKINLDGEWLSAEDLADMIQEKMQLGDMKISNLAAALEELNKALLDTHTLEIRLALSREEYEKLKALGGGDDLECVRQAITAFIGGGKAEQAVKAEDKKKAADKKEMVIKCPKCKKPIKITSDERPLAVECSHCGTGGRLTPENKWVKFK
jgi:hypothetical protein